MRQKIQERLKAQELRRKGYSVNEIVEELGVAKGSVSVWVRNVPLSSEARERLLTKVRKAQVVAAETKRRKTEHVRTQYYRKALKELEGKNFSEQEKRILCALLYWCEGAKDDSSGVYFTNSDPQLIKLFLKLFREGFDVDESKFRISLHLHEYHDEQTQIAFWSKATKISEKRFYKTYRKPHTKKE